jgi:hypothetical protein
VTVIGSLLDITSNLFISGLLFYAG